jgi:hypothetical protein
MRNTDNANLTRSTGGTADALNLDPSSIVDESAITEAALLAELSEPDALEELENLNARVGRIADALEDQQASLASFSKALHALALEQRRGSGSGNEYGAVFHLPHTPMTVARLERLLGCSPAKAAEVLDALTSSGLLGPGGCLNVRVELEPEEAER